MAGVLIVPTRPLLSLRGVSKHFGRFAALADVDLDVACGEVHALLGENGAGKSTLMKIVYGLLRPDRGTISLDGVPLQLRSALDARRVGIGMVHQEFALIDALSATENLGLALRRPGERLWNAARVRRDAHRLADEIGLELGDLDAPVGSLPVGHRQRLEIVKALAGQTRLLILDEPTAVLTAAEVEQLFAVLRRLCSAGTSVLFITHKLREVMAIADRITVLRRGCVVARVARPDTDAARLAELMVGRLDDAATGMPPPALSAPIALQLDDVAVARPGGPPALEALSLQIRAGELFGIAGVDGNGQTELFEVLSGWLAPTRGCVHVGAVALAHYTPAALLAAGVSLIPPDRQRQGVVGAMSVVENAALDVRLLRRAGSWLHPAALRAGAQALVDAYAIKAADLDAPVRSLSGGNIQKLIVARALSAAPRVVVAVNPTRGLDVAAAQAVFAALAAARAGGAAVLLLSTDLDEIVAHADRIAVLYRGRLSAALTRPFSLARLGAMLAGSEAA